jgi:ERCC4-related helicase
VQSQRYNQLLSTLKKANDDVGYLEKRQPKIAKLKEILEEHFRRHARGGCTATKVIVFAEKRMTVGDIVSEIDSCPGKPHYTTAIVPCDMPSFN